MNKSHAPLPRIEKFPFCSDSPTFARYKSKCPQSTDYRRYVARARCIVTYYHERGNKGDREFNGYHKSRMFHTFFDPISTSPCSWTDPSLLVTLVGSRNKWIEANDTKITMATTRTTRRPRWVREKVSKQSRYSWFDALTTRENELAKEGAIRNDAIPPSSTFLRVISFSSCPFKDNKFFSSFSSSSFHAWKSLDFIGFKRSLSILFSTGAF